MTIFKDGSKMKLHSLKNTKAKFKKVASRLSEAHQIRKQLRAPSGFRFVVADGISLLDPLQWDLIVKDQSLFFQRNYLTMLEGFGPENIEYKYVIIFEGNSPVAAMALQIVSVIGTQIPKGKNHEEIVEKSPRTILKNMLQPVKVKILSEIKERILVCGNLLSYGFHAIAFAPNVDRAKIWPAISEALQKVRLAEKIIGNTDFTLIKDITPDQLTASKVLSKLSFRQLETEPNMILKLSSEWKSHDNYLASLSSKYRSAYKQKIQKPIEDAGCTVEHLADITSNAERIHELYLEVHEKAGLRLFTLPSFYFAALAEILGEGFICSVIKRENKILGFVITIKDGDTAFGYHIGYDKKEAENLPLYLRLLHATIGDSCSLGCQQLSLGRTALEPKAGLGCKPEAISVWIRHRQLMMNLFLRNLLRVVTHDEAPERNPFKK